MVSEIFDYENPYYSGGQVIKIIKSISGNKVFQEAPEIKRELWGGEFWTDGYYISTISGKGNKQVIEKYRKNQGKKKILNN
jgi:putative transposase